jgi:MoxR-like ATPase
MASVTDKNKQKNPEASKLIEEFNSLSPKIKAVQAEAGKAVFGQEKVIDQLLITLLAGGHGLLVGVPGLAKTRLVTTLSRVLDLDSKRVQCTPDLMPGDIIGSELLEEDAKGKRSFRFVKGPVFCQLLMADEINRASPRTQSALLQAMQEQQVTVSGDDLDLPSPFHVLATQNPIEQEGTYPLPEAQLDRFLMQITINYPAWKAEREMLVRTTGARDVVVKKVLSRDELLKAQNLVRTMPVGDKTVDAILKLVRAARPANVGGARVARHLAWGPGPRASQAFMLAVRARSFMEGRFAPSIDDVIALAKPILQHRMALSFVAMAEGITMDQVIEELCKQALDQG